MGTTLKEIIGELWNYHEEPNTVVCITTNGFVKNNGKAVMGRGCAKEALERYPWLATELGTHIKQNGNVPLYWPILRILTFPVKHNWWEQADIDLIKDSVRRLSAIAGKSALIYVLPRPGCGNGRLNWEVVKPLLQDLPDNVWVISR